MHKHRRAVRFIQLVLFIFIYITGNAQELTMDQVKDYGDALVRLKFLTPHGRDVMVQQLQDRKIEVGYPDLKTEGTYAVRKRNQAAIMEFCQIALEGEWLTRLNAHDTGQLDGQIIDKEKIKVGWFSSPVFPGEGSSGAEYKGCIDQQTSVIGFTRMRTLNNFYKTGLVDQYAFEEARAGLESGRLRDERELLALLALRSSLHTYYPEMKKDQLVYLNRLQQADILTGDAVGAILASYRPYEIKSIPEILKYSSRYRLVDLHALPADPAQTYPVIFQEVQKLLPHFQYRKLKTQLFDKDRIEQDLRLTFEVNDINYVSSFFYTLVSMPGESVVREIEKPRVSQDFHKGINKWLTDVESPFRLYTINIRDSNEQAYGVRSVGLLLLKQGEEDLITGNGYLMSRESFDARLSRKNVDAMISALEAHGLLSQISKEQIENARKRVETAEISSLEEVLMKLPELTLVFDWETGGLESPYSKLTKALARISRGGFKPVGLIDEYDKASQAAKQVRFGFALNGKRYESMLKYENDWLDPAFLELINHALQAQHIDGGFYACINNGQEGGYIFLTAAQRAFFKSAYPDLLKE